MLSFFSWPSYADVAGKLRSGRLVCPQLGPVLHTRTFPWANSARARRKSPRKARADMCDDATSAEQGSMWCIASLSAAVLCGPSVREAVSCWPLHSETAGKAGSALMAAQAICSMAPAVTSSRALPAAPASRSGECLRPHLAPLVGFVSSLGFIRQPSQRRKFASDVQGWSSTV